MSAVLLRDNIQLRDVLVSGIDYLKLSIDENKIDGLMVYLELLSKWNKAYNLSGIKDVEEMVRLHLLDSIVVNPFLKGKNIADVGTGAGLPGIPLAILNPEKHFSLIDSNGKKTRFMTQVKAELELANIDVFHCRAEDFQTSEQIDMVLSRAFSSLQKFVDVCKTWTNSETLFLAMKGLVIEKEISQLPSNYQITDIHEVRIPEQREKPDNQNLDNIEEQSVKNVKTDQKIQRHLIEIRMRNC